MTRMASVEEIEEFMNRCYSVLDKQIFKLESEQAKVCAIQAVRYAIRSYVLENGVEKVLQILSYAKYFQDLAERTNTPPPVEM